METRQQEMKPLVLIVDDNERLCRSLARNFEDAGMRTAFSLNRAGALAAIEQQEVSVVLLDIMVGEESGVDILAALRKANPSVPVIMITGYATVETAVQALKLGAADYVKKPLDFDVLHKLVCGTIRMNRLSEENTILKRRLQERAPKLVAQSPLMKELVDRIRRLAPTELPVLITGENGTGKELVADALHEGSPRALARMIKINCAAFPESLLDNELFGHERGSYTGADTAYKGVFEQADRGTLFLDEIGDMPDAIQAKILRTLQNREIRRIGGSETLGIDVRFIAATNRPVEELMGTGRFREDVYYRLSGAVLAVPPLRDRREDIPELSRIFVEEYCLANGLGVKLIAPGLAGRFAAHRWPGNVRELKNAVNYACAVSVGSVIDLADLPLQFGAAAARGDPDGLNVREQAEKELIVKVLQQTGHNKTTTAERLAMSRKTLYNKIARYGIAASADRRG
jgi:DNA-binding NtrC family response regulator